MKAAYVDQVNAAVANHYTEFIQKSSELESNITLKASSDEVHTVVTRVETAEKTLEEKADAKDLNFAVQKITVLDEEMDTKATKEEVVDLDAKVPVNVRLVSLCNAEAVISAPSFMPA